MKRKNSELSNLSQMIISIAFSNGYTLGLERLKEKMDVLLNSNDFSDEERELIEVAQLNILKPIIDEEIVLKNNIGKIKEESAKVGKVESNNHINKEQKEALKDIVHTLTNVKNNKEEEYSHFHWNGVTNTEEIVNRERHLESMIEWAIETIGQNFDLEDE
ncbi:TscA family type II toxin-antitoxin system antitoxin [Staphylococcus pseudintermedius]|uniref:TscA family type II toxin-antitoxin system antitoxin n=1 Tax=Staphylococcus pseudintermedius TaxID=283734 RepID=UPI001F275B95|nr:hypothetical protein [Staphylococcus pseudintermedius]MDE9864449.1 hypothetical protein [Staphylococcus pseudintermedius]MDE9958794.1 hypothetical protein [Staphylococcus pseudintermedius]MDF0035008.1 hypothetical protein [Staphylococcus pseudintermedius]MDF0037417.1 hypothetical protein [Staphylococcus pseudintermedius]MDF0042153.1 hypothetical protein [Staphylococcus pseudintermedius]